MQGLISVRNSQKVVFIFLILRYAVSSGTSTFHPINQVNDSLKNIISVDSSFTKTNERIQIKELSPKKTDERKWYETTEAIAAIIGLVGVILATLGAYLGSLKGVKAQLVISEKDRADKYKLAALDKRLAVHQEAYFLCRQIIRNLHTSELLNLIRRCENFWDKKCLYLGEKSRELFLSAFKRATIFNELSNQIEEERKAKREIWDLLLQTMRIIEEETGLPSFAPEKYADEPSKEK